MWYSLICQPDLSLLYQVTRRSASSFAQFGSSGQTMRRPIDAAGVVLYFRQDQYGYTRLLTNTAGPSPPATPTTPTAPSPHTPPTLHVRERRFVLHQDREDIAAPGNCNATRVRCYVTLSGVCVTVFG